MDQFETKTDAAADKTDPANLFVRLLCLGCIAAIAWMTFNLAPAEQPERNWLAPREQSPCVMDQDGYVRGQLYGAVQIKLDWRGDSMLCDGMKRPAGQGIRLMFSQSPDPELPGLVIVIGVADAELGAPEQELEANVTLIDQVNGRFYSTQEQPRCWTRLTRQLRLTGTNEETWRLDGKLYCASALAALTGTGSVTLGDIEYSGLLKPATDYPTP
jgi:hypothetical protein